MQTVLLAAVLAVAQQQPAEISEERVARAEYPVLALIQEADVPAANAGILTAINIKESQAVQKGANVAQIDDREARGKLNLASFELAAAQEEAKNDVRVRAAAAAQKVAIAELEQAQATKARQPQAISDTELRRLQLSAERYGLEVEVAEKELAIARITENAKAAAVDLAQLELNKLNIVSPLDGRVEQVYKHLGEWVQPGDPIARIVRLDRLRVEGDFSYDKYSPDELMGRPVTVVVTLARDRQVTLQGEVTHVSALVDDSEEFQVWAEVENREENGFWVLNPGMRAEMMVHLK